jgi:hypothetical protein
MALFRRRKHLSLYDSVPHLLSFVEQLGYYDADACATLLEKLGVEPQAATRFAVFVPIAFGRVVLGDLGVTCTSSYRVEGSDELHDLAAFPEFGAATEAARRADRNRAAFRSAVEAGPEFDAVNNALNGGSRPEDLGETFLVFSSDL